MGLSNLQQPWKIPAVSSVAGVREFNILTYPSICQNVEVSFYNVTHTTGLEESTFQIYFDIILRDLIKKFRACIQVFYYM